MLKVIALAALVVVGFVLLAAVAKLLLWVALIAVLGLIGYGTYRLLSGHFENPTRLPR
jgi:hypothetical protein